MTGTQQGPHVTYGSPGVWIRSTGVKDTGPGGPGQETMEILGWTSKEKTRPHS